MELSLSMNCMKSGCYYLFIRLYIVLLPDLFKTYFDENSMLHSYNTRSKSDLHLYRIIATYGTYGQRCMKHKAVVL
jgi:hypothetical protein